MNASETTIVSRLSLNISGGRPGWFFSAFTLESVDLVAGDVGQLIQLISSP